MQICKDFCNLNFIDYILLIKLNVFTFKPLLVFDA